MVAVLRPLKLVSTASMVLWLMMATDVAPEVRPNKKFPLTFRGIREQPLQFKQRVRYRETTGGERAYSCHA